MRTKPALAAVLAAACLATACPKRVDGQSDLDPASREKVEEAKRQAEAGNPEEAMRLLRDLPAQEQEDVAVADGLFSVGEAQNRRSDFAGARKSFQELLARFPLYARADAARRQLAHAQLELGEFQDALQSLAPVYPRLPPEERPAALRELLRASEGAQAWGEAVRWHLEAMQTATDEASQQASSRRVFELLDTRVAFLDVARLAEELPTDSALWPLVQLKLAKILAHLRDPVRLKETLEKLVAKAPQSREAAEARTMLERAARRVVARPDTIGLVAPLSGKYKSFGDSVVAGVELALQGSSLKLVVRDSLGDPAEARKAVAALTQDEHVLAIIGPVLSAESEDAAAEAELQETPIVTLTRAEGITRIGDHVFRNMLTNSAQAAALADWATRVKGFKQFALLYPNIPYGNELAHRFWDELDARDAEVRGAESYDADQTTFAPVVKRLVGRQDLELREEYVTRRQEILKTVKDPYRQRKLLEEARSKLPPIIDFEVLFVPDYYKNIGLLAPALAVEDVITNVCDPKDLERIAKTQGKEPKDLKPVQLIGANGWNFKELVERGGKFVQCAVFVDGFFVESGRKETSEFVAAFRKAYERDPALLEAEGFDTAKIMRHLIETRRPQTRAALREALLQVKEFPGATGRTSFDANREAQKPLFMLTIDKGLIREVEAEPVG